MAQHEITRCQAMILQHMQKVVTTYEHNYAIGRRLDMSPSAVRSSIIRLMKLNLIAEQDDEGQRLLEITKLGKKHMIILDEIKRSRWT